MARFVVGQPITTSTPTIVVDAGLAAGRHAFSLVVVDAAGNESRAANVIVSVSRPDVQPTPGPIPVPVPVPGPIPIPFPTPFPIPTPLPTPVPVPIPVPRPTPIPTPGPVIRGTEPVPVRPRAAVEVTASGRKRPAKPRSKPPRKPE